MKTNTRARKTVARKTVTAIKTHEGGRAVKQSSLAELERTVVNCLLFENTFYEKGSGIADRIKDLTAMVPAEEVSHLAIRTRNELGLRHVSLWLTLALARVSRGSSVTRKTIEGVVKRADELSEMLSLYWRMNGTNKPISNQVKKGLASAFTKFDEYQLAKYNRDAEVKLKDVMFLVHPKPDSLAQAALFKRLIDGTMKTPDTWETLLSAGKDKKATFEMLISERKLGALALLRNLRNMDEAKVDRSLVLQALRTAKTDGILPFQFVSAAATAPAYTAGIEEAMLRGVSTLPKVPGTTILLIDVSGSMHGELSRRGSMTRIGAASALGIQLREQCEDARIFTFSDSLKEVKAHRGLGLIEGIWKSQPHSGTSLGLALRKLKTEVKDADRIVVITDEQSQDGTSTSVWPHSYLVNVAPYAPGLSLAGGWHRINGFSERLVEWILRTEECGDAYSV